MVLSLSITFSEPTNPDEVALPGLQTRHDAIPELTPLYHSSAPTPALTHDMTHVMSSPESLNPSETGETEGR